MIGFAFQKDLLVRVLPWSTKNKPEIDISLPITF